MAAVRGLCCQIYRNNTSLPRRLLFSNWSGGKRSFSGSLGTTESEAKAKQPGKLLCRNVHSLAVQAQGQASFFVLRTQRYATGLTQNCWKCGTQIDPQGEQYFCDCGVIQPPKRERNFFEVLGIEQSFDLNTMVLTKRFRDLQRNLHPDRFTQKSEEEKRFSEEQSSTVNRAYQTLLKPLPRGLYLLELSGHSIEDGEIQQDPEFLMDIMEINEAVAEMTSKEEMKRLGRANRRLLNELTVKVCEAFSANDILQARQLLAKLKYYANIDDKISEFKRNQSDRF